MKRILSVILILALLCGCALSEEQTGLAVAEAYKNGKEELYLDHYDAAIKFFENAGSYSNAKYFARYAEALQKILDSDGKPEYLEQAYVAINTLSRNARLVEELSQYGFPACDEILRYIDARKLENAGKISEAIEIYQDLFILDAYDRSYDLTINADVRQYEEAMALYDAGDYVEAAKAFEALGDYLNSEQMCREAFSKHPHDWADATCETAKTCKVCGMIDGEALGHDWADATCETAKTCKVCGQTEGKELGHKWTSATCTEPKTCSVCGKTEGRELGHSYTSATCTEPRTCARCEKTDGSALGHSYTVATCTEPRTCSRCGQTNGSALGHDYAPATYDAPETCRRCGVTRGEKLRRDYQVGDYVTFGTYPQTASGTDNTPIEWLVLDRNGDEYLLISRYALKVEKYNKVNTDITWATCSLRTWLNNDFYIKAFSADEKQRIVLSKVTADKNPSYSTNPGNVTTDNVFLLSISEVNRYFKDNTSRMCAPTDYAVKCGAYTNSGYTVDGRASCCWWLRSPGSSSIYAAGVSGGGSVFDRGYSVNRRGYCVRPCVWVRLF